MEPEVRFTISAEAAQQLDQILTANGLSFVRLSRETFEVIDKNHPYAVGGGDYEKFHGVLKFNAREFPCSIERYTNKQILCVTGDDLEDKWSHELIAILERAFPQPRRGILNTPKPERKVDKRRIISSIGCIAMAVVILGILFLAIVGALSAFR